MVATLEQGQESRNGNGDKVYPISEIFSSPQGEGMFAGQMQTFIRLAGCTVGKRYESEAYKENHFPIYTERCTIWNGNSFPCDTDYRVKSRLTTEDIVSQIPSGVDNVCITGGEPLMHNINTLVTYLWTAGKTVHIETSGTKFAELDKRIWVTVSPKFGVLQDMMSRADEIKLLVDDTFSLDTPIETYPSHTMVPIPWLAKLKPVYLQPVNDENDIRADNLQRCLDWQRKCPSLRVCIQLHKAIGSIINEHVR